MCEARVSRRFFFPTIQLWPATGARTLLHIGTHRKEYKDLNPNHLYYMQWRLQGLVQSPFVEDVHLAESRFAYNWLFSLYRKLKNSSILLGDMSKSVMALQDTNMAPRMRANSL